MGKDAPYTFIGNIDVNVTIDVKKVQDRISYYNIDTIPEEQGSILRFIASVNYHFVPRITLTREEYEMIQRFLS